MLSPNGRSMYTDALVPPDGYQLDSAIATTYSMDLTTLLSIPLQLVMQATEDYQELFKDPVALYEALQRATNRVRVFAHRGQIHVPRQKHMLYSLLEPMIQEVTAPRGGAFHAKLWLLRFREQENEKLAYRLMVPTKNLTSDKAWDMALTIDGRLRGRSTALNNPLIKLLDVLPALGAFDLDSSGKELLGIMKDEVKQVEWELPNKFDAIRFQLLGLDSKTWSPKKNDRLAVISPFLGQKALKQLAATSGAPMALISRSEALNDLRSNAPFEKSYVLHDAAETEDGEDLEGRSSEVGLHAKVYVFQAGNRTHITMGSANATDAALVASKNVEILVDIAGLSRRVGRVSDILSIDEGKGLGNLLVPWQREDITEIEKEQRESEKLLEEARRALIAGGLELICREEDNSWNLELHAKKEVQLASLNSAKSWPVTLGRERAVSLDAINDGEPVLLPGQSIASLTTLIAFELEAGKESLAFVLNLPVSGMPQERERAVLKHVVNNREGFLRYLLLLLAGLGNVGNVGSVARALGKASSDQIASLHEDAPLLEELVRAFAREPKRLQKVQRLVDELAEDSEGIKILPKGFLGFWEVFREALADRAN